MSKRVTLQFTTLSRMEERIKDLLKTGWKLISRHSFFNKSGEQVYMATLEPSDNG